MNMNARETVFRLLSAVRLCALPCILLSGSQAMAQTTHYVDNLGDCAASVPCYARIMFAVDAAAPSDVIEVFPGVYHEGLVFGDGKDNIVLRARFGALKPVIAAPPEASWPMNNGVTLHATGVQVRGFLIEAAGGAGVVGDGLIGSTGAVIQGNLITASGAGITFQPCRSSAITNNRVLSGGIAVHTNSEGCSVEGNTVDGASVQIGDTDFGTSDNLVRQNLVRGGNIVFPSANPLLRNTVESNRVESGNIELSATCQADGNVIRHNIVRGGGVLLSLARSGCTLGANMIDANFVSGGPGDGIALHAVGGQSSINGNTSIENAGCDLSDSALSGGPQNAWTNNRFSTSCGAATNYNY
jgi:hypothetical protein